MLVDKFTPISLDEGIAISIIVIPFFIFFIWMGYCTYVELDNQETKNYTVEIVSTQEICQ